MTKSELIDSIAVKANLNKKEAKAALDATLESIVESLAKGENLQLVGFGTFKVRERAAREGRNPKTKETIQIPASKTPSFVAGKSFKDALK